MIYVYKLDLDQLKRIHIFISVDRNHVPCIQLG